MRTSTFSVFSARIMIVLCPGHDIEVKAFAILSTHGVEIFHKLLKDMYQMICFMR